jgi:mono/diheme cytochrome c family protein
LIWITTAACQLVDSAPAPFQENTTALPICPVGASPAVVAEGAWYWLRSPEQGKRVTMGLYNRFCIRCHGVDGRGVWDIPGIPDFTNPNWQSCRSEPELVRAILEGRRWCMPPFRAALSSEEAWSMAHYLRTFVPGTEMPRPDTTVSQRRETQQSQPKSR